MELTEDDYGALMLKSRHPNYGECTVALLTGDGNNLRQQGSGTLFRIGSESFLITAAHVVSGQASLYMAGGTGKVVGMGGRVISTSALPDEEYDFADIAIWHLEDDTVHELDGCVFLRQTDFAVNDPIEQDGYVFSGYPVEWADTFGEAKSLKLLTYCTTLYEKSRSAFPNCLPGHILLSLGGAVGRDGEVMPSRLNGISGCSIWRTYCAQGSAEPGQAKVVAVQTAVYAGKVVKGTPWRVVAKAIYASFPQLRRSLDLLLPRRLG